MSSTDNVVTFAGIYFLLITFGTFIFNILQWVYIYICNKLCPENLQVRLGKWAVVTGGTDGIGKYYARELARRGMNVVIISRNIDKLTNVATEIEQDFAVGTRVIQLDFSEADRKAYDELQRQIKDLDIGILVNNVGVIVPYPQLVTEMSDEQIWQHVNVNVASLTIMTRLVLSGMQQRRRGAIVNLSSMAALAPTPFLSVYAATKAYVDYFSEALSFECRGSGVHVQTVRPCYVNTQMVSYSDGLSAGGLMVPSAEVFAKHAVSTLGFVGATTGYWPHSLQHWFISLAPRWLWIITSGLLNKNFRQVYDKKNAQKTK